MSIIWYHGTWKEEGNEDSAIAVFRGGADSGTGSKAPTNLKGALQGRHGEGHEGLRRVVRRSYGDALAMLGNLDDGRWFGGRGREGTDGRRGHDDEKYRARREAIEQLVDNVAKMLDQEAMAVIVSKASDGYLLFPDEA